MTTIVSLLFITMIIPIDCKLLTLIYIYSLSGICFVQGLLTFAYISLLFSVGERVAVRMRTDLFHSLMQQDVSFFDVNKTGELVNR